MSDAQYSINYIPVRRPVVIETFERERICPRCRKTFRTLATGPKVRCKPCREIVNARTRGKANARAAARRRAKMGMAA